jgi:hypothetical protein
MATYVIAEIGDEGPEPFRSVEGLSVAKQLAEERARSSERPVVIRESATGRELARYEPSKRPAAMDLDAVLDKLRDATERMAAIVRRKGQKRNGNP